MSTNEWIEFGLIALAVVIVGWMARRGPRQLPPGHAVSIDTANQPAGGNVVEQPAATARDAAPASRTPKRGRRA